MIKSRESHQARAFASVPAGQAAAVTLLAATLALAACGGSDDNDSPAPAPAPAPTTPAPTPSAPPPTTVTAQDACQASVAATGASVDGSLAGRVSNPGNLPLTFTVVQQPTRGTVSIQSNGAFTYQPTGTGRGYADSFRYRVSGGQGVTSEATATVIYGRARIMPLGDSITQGVETVTSVAGPPEAQRIAYRKQLVDRLTADGYAVDMVGSLSDGAAAGLVDSEHEGHGGETTQFIANNVTGYLTASKPDVVLLHIGTNDATDNVAPMQALLANASNFASIATNEPVRLLLARIIGYRTGTAGSDRVGRLNANVDSLYQSTYAGTTLTGNFTVRQVDMFSAIDPVADMTPAAQDSTGLHPNAAGYQKMGNTWYEALVQQKFVNKCP